jgi:hypothetical protein
MRHLYLNIHTRLLISRDALFPADDYTGDSTVDTNTPGGKIMARGTSGAVSVHLKSSYTKFKVIF